MLFQIIYPFNDYIYGDSFKEAVKNYVKYNHAQNIHNLIIKDQANHYKTKLRYYRENNKNKVGIDVYPFTDNSYPIIPVAGIQGGPVVRSNTPVTFVPNSLPLIVNSNGPYVTANGQNFIATDDNIIINHPFIN